MVFVVPFSAMLIYYTVLLNYLQCFISDVVLFLAVSLLVASSYCLFQSYISKSTSVV